METAIDMALGGATLAACPLSALVLSFAFYGFCGWAWESTVCAMLNHGRFANSGFLLGPCCPIYGAGGIACWLLLRGILDASSQFVAAALVCSVIEYSVGVLLEKTTGARFWDYSHLPFNLHGRICLYWACAFGVHLPFSGAGIAGAAWPSAGADYAAVRLYRRGRDDGRRGVLVGELAASV